MASVRRSADEYAIFATINEADMEENQDNNEMDEEYMERNEDNKVEDVLDEVAELARSMSNDDLF
nr:hypothetical protein [Tanacetum cinerariifolium]